MKSNFKNYNSSEDELFNSMNNQLVKNASSINSDDLVNAVDYLNSAIDIFEDAGMQVQADKILNILVKIANKKEHREVKIDHLKIFKDLGISKELLIKSMTNDEKGKEALKEVNYKLYKNGYTIQQVLALLGEKYTLMPEEVRDVAPEDVPIAFMVDADKFIDPNLEDQINTQRAKPLKFNLPVNDFVDTSRKKSVLAKVKDRHTKNLTSEKMTKNLKHHGTVFNLSDDKNYADDILNADTDDLYVEEDESDNFED